MRTSLATILAVAAWPALVLGQEADKLDWKVMPPAGVEHEYQPPLPTRQALDGGGALLVVEDHALPLCAVEIVVTGAGSAADPPGRAGLAAFTANLLDEGAGGLGALALAEALESLGAELSISVDEDAAHLRVSTLSRELPATLEVVGKVLTSPAFDDAEARRVHEDQATGVRLRRDRPGAVASLMLRAALFGAATAYGHPLSGHIEDLGRFGVADARAFYRRSYSRANLVVVVAGDVTPAGARKLVDAMLDGWSADAQAAIPLVAAFAKSGARLRTIDRPGAEQANLLIGAPGLTRDDPRSDALEVATNVLGGTYGSRLNRRLREELGLTYGVRAETWHRRGAGSFSVETDVESPRAREAISEILRLAAAMGTTQLSREELEAGKANLVRGLPDFFRTQEDVAEAFASLAVLGLPDDWFAGYAERIRGVTEKQVLEVSRAVFAPAKLVVIVVGPMREIGAGLKKLGLGPMQRHDPDGKSIGR